MFWSDIRVGKKLIGEPVERSVGYEYCFVTLPKNNLYDKGYGFFISAKLVMTDCFSLPDDYKVELQMNPSLREDKKRYKRYKLTGAELKETVLEPYIVDLKEECTKREAEKRAERDRRNKKVFGRVVYGRYQGNNYGESGDSCADFYFVHDGIFYNGRHQKVANVTVKFVVAENASKYLFESVVDLLRGRIGDWNRIDNAVSELRKVTDSVEGVESAIYQLEVCKQKIIDGLIAVFEHYRSENEGSARNG